MTSSRQTSDEHFLPLRQASLSSYDSVTCSLAKIYDVVIFMQKRASFTTWSYGFHFFPFSFDVGLRFRDFFRTLVCVGVLLGVGLPFAFAEEEEPLKELPRAVFRHTPPLFAEWNFETDVDAVVPPGFSPQTLGHGHPGEWTVQTDDHAPSRTHALVQSTSCLDSSCYQLLINDAIRVEYLDLSVGILSKLGTPTSAAGLVLGMQDLENFYAVLVYPASNVVRVHRFVEGVPTLIKEHAVIPKKRTPWHFLRIQRNTIVSKEFFEISFDNQFFLSVYDSTFHTGQIGLVTTGGGAFAFDNLRVVELLTSRPLSRPPAY